MAGEEGQTGVTATATTAVTQNTDKVEGSDEDLDFEEYSEKTNEFFEDIISKLSYTEILEDIIL
nr:hypothetical protein Iba_chr09dCG4210 [Ipomoea batatas]GMD36866.1 hypothetical protein Iba_chr09eCG4000 [Ipomoea batatas]